ncbi:MAG: thioredoxin domain-containing protein [Dehalococcoidales bacterium]|nr:thioredoxin domain-containing protein [Dehalococcoidales bacterium]
MQAYDDYHGKILLVYHPYAPQELSEKIAVALEAAGEQDKFWEMHDYLILKEPGDISVILTAATGRVADIDEFTVDYLETAAENIGLDMDFFTAAMNSPALLEKVRLSREEALSDGVKSAALFINGEEYREGHSSIETFYRVLDEELERLEADAAE